MESPQRTNYTPWIIGGCSLILVVACAVSFALGTGGLLFARFVYHMSRQGSPVRPPVETSVDTRTAILQDIQGWVEIQNEKGDWSPAGPDHEIVAGNNIRTGKLSSARLTFHDGSQALLKAESEIAVDEVDAGGEGPRVIVLTQVAGESTHQVMSSAYSASLYEVRTPGGAGIAQGTEFDVIVTAQQTAYYYVVQGVVAVSAVNTTVLVNPGFMTILYYNLPPLEPVQTVSVEGLVSLVGDQWTVAGTTFTLDDDVMFAGEPQVGDWVLVKGHLDESDQVVADWIILLRRAVTNRFSLTGAVEAIGSGEWTVNGQAVVITETTELDDIQIGDMVYAKGIITADGALQAERIERLGEEAGLPFAFTGVIEWIDEGWYDISGISVSTIGESVLSDDLQAGDMVDVKGLIQDDGTWLATKITRVEEKDSEFRFTGELESLDPWEVAGIRFETRDYTVIQADLEIGDLVRVEGAIDPGGAWIAAKIERIDEAVSKMVVIGTLITIDPWVVNGITLTLAPGAVIDETVTVGMLVRVELVLQADGTWLVVLVEPLDGLVWFPGCMDVIATVVALDGNQLQLLNWPVVTVADDASIEGTLTPNSVIRMRVCFDEAMLIRVTYIVIIQPGVIIEPPSDGGGDKVLVCHKPDKKGGHTLSISRSALPAHLAHGDYEGTCR